MSKTYNWHRFWLPADSSVYLDDDAYLPDPTEKYLEAFNPGVADLFKLREQTCKVLLGESGMGKSSTLRADFARLQETWTGTDDRGALIDIGAVTNLTDLRSEIQLHPEVRAWRASGRGFISIYFDSLDEAIPGYSAVSKGLMTVIRELGNERLRVSIACRTGEFPSFLENELISHFGSENVTRWQLAPLTRAGIRAACADNSVDYDDFMQAVWEGNLQPLAARPITLELLLRAARTGGESIKDVRTLYERGCRELISERSASSRSTQSRRLDLDQSMAVAGRVACATVFGARMIVSAETGAGSQLGVVTSSEIVGDRETANGNPFAVTEAEVVEVLRTGLFTATGMCFRWAHKSYAEFIAARHVCASGMPRRNKVALITSGGRVPAALRGVAGWLTSLDAEVRSEILRLDPEAMLQADLSLATNDQKAEIVNWLLRQGESDSPLIHESGMSLKYRSLKHPGLVAKLQPVMEDSTSRSARYCAIQIADACGEGSLQAILADLALRPSESIYLRIAAASSVADHGDAGTKARLLPLALQEDLAQDAQRLQVQALMAVWPQSCSWAELRDCLGRSDYSLTDGIGRFIGYDLPKTMKPEDWPVVLAWLSLQGHPTSGLSAWVACGDRILQQAARSNDASVNGAIVDLLRSRSAKHEKMFGSNHSGHGYEPWPEDVRRSVAAGLVPRLVDNIYAAAETVRGERPLLVRGDFDFAIKMWDAASAPEKILWQTIAGYLVDWDSASAAEAALAKTRIAPALHDYLRERQRGLQSQQTRERREAAKREKNRGITRKKRIDQIRELLRKAQSDYGIFWSLLYLMSFPLDGELGYGPHEAISKLPGWEILSAAERVQVVEAGKRFLNEAKPKAFPEPRHGNLTNYAIAGYWVFFELITKEPAYLEGLPDEIWRSWTPGIIAVQCDVWDEHNASVGLILLGLSVRRAELTAIRSLAVALRTGHARRVVPVMQAMDGAVSSKEFDKRVLRALRSSKILGDAYLAGMRMLVEREYWDAIRTIEDTVGRIQVARDADLPRLGANAVLLLHYEGPQAWPALWTNLQRRPPFVAHLLTAFGHEGGVGVELALQLSDDELAALYVWLRNKFGTNPEVSSFGGTPEWVAQGTILTELQNRVRPESVSVLESLAQTFPDDWYVRKSAWDARRQLLDSRWVPLAPELVKRITTDRRQMIARDEEELAEAVWQSLIDYQASILGEGSRVMRLWNEPAHTPKEEESISREIGHELQEMLVSRGVSVTCETKIREAQYVDLYVTAVIPGPEARRLSLIIEIKGCWHRELLTAQKTQLAMRYLRDNLSTRGIYLVAWFLCDRWNGKPDGRKGKTPKTTVAQLRDRLDRQAQCVSAETRSDIRAFVLDATIEGAAPKASVSRRRGVKGTASGVMKRSRSR